MDTEAYLAGGEGEAVEFPILKAEERLSAWVRGVVRQRGWRDAELARRAGFTTGKLSKLLSGAQHYSIDDLLAIARALEIGTSALLAAALEEQREHSNGPTKPSPPVAPTDQGKPSQLEIMRRIARLQDEIERLAEDIYPTKE